MFPASQTQSAAHPGITAQEMIEAANEASGQSRNMWILFIAVLAYLIVTIAGTTHEDLLLNNPVTLPFLEVDIPLFAFFIYGPLVVLSLHLGLLVQHAMLAFKLFRLTELLQDGGWHRPGTDLRRSKLHPYIFAQLIAGPVRSPLMGFLMGLMTWFSLVALPVLTLIFFQVAFLPFHDEVATYWHRAAVLLDCIILIALVPYMRPASKSEAKAREDAMIGELNWPRRSNFFGTILGGFAMVGLLLFSWFIATIPDGCAYRNKETGTEFLCLDKMMAQLKPWTVEISSGNTVRDVFWPTAVLFEGGVDPVTGQPTSVWSRNIVLTDADLVPEKEFDEGEVSLSLRGRDLRYAVLDRTDLHRVDFTGVDLRGASLKETRLEEARFCLPLKVSPRKCSEFAGADLRKANLQGVDFWGAKLDNAELSFVRLEGADFRNAQLEGANLSFAELKGADLSLANLKGAKFSYAKLPLANFTESELTKASFDGANLQGANLGKALLEGANLTSADLKGALLNSVNLSGADLREAKLQGTDLRMSDLRGADLEEASLKGSDLRFVRLWGAKAPGEDRKLELARTAGISFEALDQDEVQELKDTLSGISDAGLRASLSRKFRRRGLLREVDEEVARWEGKSEWESLMSVATPETDYFGDGETTPVNTADQRDKFWAELACRHVDIAESLAKRLVASTNVKRRTSMSKSLTMRTCDAAVSLTDGSKFDLCHLARWDVAELKDTICRE